MEHKKTSRAYRSQRERQVRAALIDLREALVDLYGQDAPTAILYGSHARGEADAASDVDILLIYSDRIKRGQEIRHLSPILADLNLKYQVLLSILPSDQAEYTTATGPFWSNVRREGVQLDTV